MSSRFDQDPKATGPVVQGFAGRGFSVDGGVYEGLLLTPLSARQWDPPALADLTILHLEELIGLQPPPEFLLLGTGSRFSFAPPKLVRALEERGIGIEAMDSRAAARTWGILRGEERWIAAALMPLD
ncbi:MAG TPA: Mth938-like domain-containing protein [Allosphingosinicella sp.]|uniref:Mth938-like domain-containing protein n=1 Tax=Allosphingosinicella sp. TaxID=2823234 RepID=UPI002ED91772